MKWQITALNQYFLSPCTFCPLECNCFCFIPSNLKNSNRLSFEIINMLCSVQHVSECRNRSLICMSGQLSAESYIRQMTKSRNVTGASRTGSRAKTSGINKYHSTFLSCQPSQRKVMRSPSEDSEKAAPASDNWVTGQLFLLYKYHSSAYWNKGG